MFSRELQHSTFLVEVMAMVSTWCVCAILSKLLVYAMCVRACMHRHFSPKPKFLDRTLAMVSGWWMGGDHGVDHIGDCSNKIIVVDRGYCGKPHQWMGGVGLGG